MTPPEKQVLKTKICCSCKVSKTIDKYHRNSVFKDGYDSRCKMCKQTNRFCKQRRDHKVKNDSVSIRLTNLTKNDWVETYYFLKSIGYELSGPKSIHEQFCLKYNLEPKEHYNTKKIKYFSAEELGII